MSQYPRIRNKNEQLVLNIATKLQASRSSVPTCTSSDKPLTVVCISDTHCGKSVLPEGDLLVHSGDLTNKGTFDELQEQFDWLNEQPHEHKVIIGGNHDLLLDDTCEKTAEPGKTKHDLQFGDLIYLEDSSTNLRFSNGRNLKIYGNPYTPKFGEFSFQYPRISEHEFWLNKIPNDADIVVTHGPPRFHLDKNDYGGNVGCEGLLKELYRTRPKLFVCGHIHDSAGQQVLTYDNAQQGWEEAMRKQARFTMLPGIVWGSIIRSFGSEKRTLLVNAAMMSDHKTGKLRAANVVTI